MRKILLYPNLTDEKTDIQRVLSNLCKVTLGCVVELGLELRPWLCGLAPECYATF